MVAAEERTRSRSRSPKAEQTAESSNQPASPNTSVPAHWLKAAAPAESEKVCVPSKGKGGGKGKAAGKRAALLAGSIGDDTLEKEEPVTACVLFALAQALDSGFSDQSPAQLVATIRRAATRMGKLERSIGEIGHALRSVATLSSQTLAATGLLAGDVEPSQLPDVSAEADSARSFMVKQASEDVAEAHRAAQQLRPGTGVGHEGGVLSTEAKSKEEMEAARKARLARLESQQADKAKEIGQAEAKNKAREALFNRPNVGAAKPLGQT